MNEKNVLVNGKNMVRVLVLLAFVVVAGIAGQYIAGLIGTMS